MAVRKLLERLLHIVGESGDYFVSGSLSFLPLVEAYREPAHDVDASMSVTLFESRRDVVAAQGRIQILRLGEVAVAQDSRASRVLSPRTDFIHVNTPDGLLDLTVHRIARNSLVMRLGAGLTIEVPRYVLDRIRVLIWEGISYRAGPPELAFLPKAVWYLRSHRAPLDGDLGKHLRDLTHMLPIIDWPFLAGLIRDGSLRWLGARLPGLLDRRLNPFGGLDLEELRERLESEA